MKLFQKDENLPLNKNTTTNNKTAKKNSYS